MKKFILILISVIFIHSSCKKADKIYEVNNITVQLVYPQSTNFKVIEGVKVKMTAKNLSFEAVTDATGKATFSVPSNVYQISATDVRSESGTAYNFNGNKSNLAVSANAQSVNLDLQVSKSAQVLIKELFVGGSLKDDGSGTFQFDKYLILYNNSSAVANLGNLCIGMIAPFNSTGTNAYYNGGKLIYESENWMPAIQGYWYFQRNVSVQPYTQIVIALTNAVNNTLTHSKSINFDNPNYFAMYDIAGQYKNTSYYVSPAASIPSTNYLKSATYATANAWSLSVTSPGLFLFDPKGTTPAAFANDVSKTHTLNSANISKKVPVDWIIDGVEAYVLNSVNTKRFLPTVDAGYVNHLNNLGYSIYRNVDVDATKAIPGNEAKLIKNYQLGTTSIGGSTDPSGIDAEASIKNGATIIYKDTNNSTNDFHLRSKASLRTN